jgi:hypothetical protein
MAALLKLYPQGKKPGTNWIGVWVSPRADLDAVGKEESCCPFRESNSGRLALCLVSIMTEPPPIYSYHKNFKSSSVSVFSWEMTENLMADSWVV